MLVLLDPAARPVIGHRGARALVPENTLPSFAHAARAGVDAIELDLHLSSDGVPVVMHDPTLDRTTDARGPIADRSADELSRMDAGWAFTTDGGASFPFRGQGIGVPTLDEVLSAHPSLPMILEIKALAAARSVLTLIERAGAASRVLIGSFIDEALVPFADAGVPVSAPPGALKRFYLPALVGLRPSSFPFDAMCIPRFHRGLPLPIRGFARLMRRFGRTTHIWTVNEPRLAHSLWRRGVQGIISDDPTPILAARQAAA